MSKRRIKFLKEICKAKGKPFTKQVLRDWKKIPVDQKEFISKGWGAVEVKVVR